MRRISGLLSTALVTFVLSFSVAHATFISYTDPSAFQSATIIDFVWDFEGVPHHNQWHDYVAPDGSTIMPLVFSNQLTPWSHTLFNLNDTTVYMNPQLSKAFLFGSPVESFGIFGLWSNIYTPGGIAVSAYDSTGQLIGRAVTTGNDAIQTIPNGPSMNWYESFIGFTSSVPIASIYFDNEIGGSAQYDNAMLHYATPVSEPSVIFIFLIGFLGFFSTQIIKKK